MDQSKSAYRVALGFNVRNGTYIASALADSGMLESFVGVPLRSEPIALHPPLSKISPAQRAIYRFNQRRVVPGLSHLRYTPSYLSEVLLQVPRSAPLGARLARSQKAFGNVLARSITSEVNAVHFASGVGLESMRQNKSRDLLWVCQRRALHQEVEARLSEAEGSDYVHPERVISSKLNSEYERSDVILCNSRLTASTFVSMGYPESRLRVVHNGVDTEFFRPDDADDPASHQRDSPCSLRMLFVGSVDRRKGFDLLLAALDRLPESVQLRVAGAASASAVARVARDERVLYLGKLSPGELRAQYRWADVTVLPSRADAFGYVGSESLACGTPVVASDMTGVSEVIADHRAGWVFESGRADSLLEALEQAIDEPEMLIAAKLGTARSNPYLGWGRFARELISVYSDSF